MAIVYKDSGNTESDFQDSLGQKYSIDSLQYPSSLDASPEFGYNKVVFFINVQGGGKFAQDKQNEMKLMDVPPSDYGDYLAGRKGLEKIADVAESFGVNLTVAQKMKRLSSAIVLYVPNNLRTGYSVNWSEEDFQKEEIYAELGLAASKGALVSGIKTAAAGASARTLNGLSYVQKATKITPGNAKAEQLFKGVNFRDFSFDYQFTPRSEKEATAVMNIIRMFRHHMLPEFKDQANFLYIYPSEFDIKYYKGSAENEYIEKHMTCVLTNMIVDYTPNGQFTTFSNGMPTQINMNLSFRELSLTTKETSPFDKRGV
jgi:hypothetical protein